MAMPATSGFQPFSTEDAWVFPFSAGVPGSGFDIPGIVDVGPVDWNTTDVEHRGDNAVIAKGRTIDSGDLTLTVANWDPTAISKLVGGTVGAVTGTTPNQIVTLTHKVTDQPADCAIAAQTRSKSPDGGAARVVFPRCQSQSLPTYGFTDADFNDLDIDMSAIAATGGEIVYLQQMETYAALTSTYPTFA